MKCFITKIIKKGIEFDPFFDSTFILCALCSMLSFLYFWIIKKGANAPFLIPSLFFMLYALCFPFDIPKSSKKALIAPFLIPSLFFVLYALCFKFRLQIRISHHLNPKLPQKVNPFIRRQAFISCIGIQEDHFLNLHAVNNPRTRDARG